MIKLENAYARICQYAKDSDLTLLESVETFIPGALLRRSVRCNKCGTEYTAVLRKQNSTPCPTCGTKLVRDPLASYTKYKAQLLTHDIELLIPFEDWKGPKNGNKEHKYPMQCTKCGHLFEGVVGAHNRGCPGCSQSVTSSPEVNYTKFINEVNSIGAVPLFSKEDWQGVSYSCSSGNANVRSYQVRCTVCGTEFFCQRKSKGGITECPICTRDVSTNENKYRIFQEWAENNNLELLTPLSQFQGFMYRDINGTLLRRKYSCKCRLCGSVFTTSRISTKGSTEFQKCECQLTQNPYKSHRELEVYDWLVSKGLNVLQASRRVLKNLELDIYIPDQQIAFEFNGMYFHSSGGNNPSKKQRSYHSTKTTLALQEGIKCYHIWDDCPDDLMYSILESKLGLSHRVYARTLSLQELTPAQGSAFFQESHADGNNSAATKYLALVDTSATVYCCMSLMQRRIQATNVVHWEIGRFANRKHFTVVGGYSKLLKYAVGYLKSQGINELVSYCNRDLSPDPNSTFYAKQGFEFLGDTGNIYWYYTNKEIEINGKSYKGRIPRQAVQKQKLLKHFVSHNLPVHSTDTESTLTHRLGLVPVYNSGNFKYILRF